MTLEELEAERARTATSRPQYVAGMKSQNCHKENHKAENCNYAVCVCECHKKRSQLS